jgi:hypothetical protein
MSPSSSPVSFPHSHLLPLSLAFLLSSQGKGEKNVRMSKRRVGVEEEVKGEGKSLQLFTKRRE